MKFFSLLLILISLRAQAEYRMFLLKIKTSDGSEKFIKSNLDPDQYRGYHPVPQGAQITYTDTWMCRGRTDFQEACKSPRELASEGNPTPNSSP